MAGDAAGHFSKGCWTVRLDNKLWSVPQLIWLYVHGYIPTKRVGHRNGNPHDLRLENLYLIKRREVRSLTHARLFELMFYDPETGLFSDNGVVRRWRYQNSTLGYIGRLNYITIVVDGKHYRAHRLAWFYVHGKWPTKHLDHANGDPSDNRISNLREATRSQNMANARKPRNNTSGLKGVSRRSDGKKWVAQIMVRGVKFHLGSFDRPEDAHAVYCKAAAIHQGAFARVA